MIKIKILMIIFFRNNKGQCETRAINNNQGHFESLIEAIVNCLHLEIMLS